MAISSYVGTELNQDTNTFEDWFTKTNQIITDLGTTVVTAEATANGSSTTGNIDIIGILSSDTIAVGTELRGGGLGNTQVLNITSDVNFTGNDIDFDIENYSLAADAYIVTSNVVTFSGDSISLNSTLSSITGTTLNIGSTTTNINSDSFNISANTQFSANTVTFNNVVVDGQLTYGSNSEIVGDQTFSSNVTFSGSEVVFSANATFSGGFSVGGGGGITVESIDVNAITANTVTANTVTAEDFNSTSDIKLKENILPITNSISTINLINPVSFDWKETGKKSYGVIAQELEEVLPELVKEREDGTKTVSYQALIGFLISAIKEQHEEIQHIKSMLS